MRLLPLFPKPRNDEFCGILVWEFRLGILDWNSSLGILIWNSRIPIYRDPRVKLEDDIVENSRIFVIASEAKQSHL